MARKLSDLGINASTQSSALSPARQGPDLAALLGNSQIDSLGKARLLNHMIAQRQQGQPNLLQQLLSPGGIAGAVGTGIAGAVGGGEAALAFGGGALGGLLEQREAQRTANEGAIEQLMEQRDDALGRVEKSQQRISNLLTTQPDLFLNPETGETNIDPNLLGLLATGEPIRLNPSARRQLARRDATWKARDAMLRDALEEEDTLAGARVLTRAWFQNMDYEAPDEVVEAMARSMGTPDFDSTLAGILAEHGGTSFLSAAIAAREQGVPLDDPNIMAMINWNEAANSDISSDEYFVSLVGRMNAWSSDPQNRGMVIGIAQEAGDDVKKKNQLMAEAAFAGQQGDINAWITKTSNFSDSDMALLTRSMIESGDWLGLTEILASTEVARFLRDKPEEEQIRYRGQLASRYFQTLLDIKRGNSAQRDAYLLNSTQEALANELQMSTADARNIAIHILVEAQKETADLNGNIDQDKYERTVDAFTKQVIEQNKQGK